jgi:hypothetical protein
MGESRLYRIEVKGRLGPEWSAWFHGLSITDQPDGVTVLAGRVADQAALHGLLDRIHDLGLVLLSVSNLELNQTPDT